MLTNCGSSSNEPVKTSAATTSNEQPATVETKEGEAVQYNLQSPSATWTLPDELFEISGNAWIDDKHLLVIEDLHPNLYVVRLDKTAAIEKKVPFAPEKIDKFDIEDVAFNGKTAYALWSHGTIYKIDDWQTSPKVSNWETGLKKSNNTEGLCYDPLTKKLLVACKNDSGDDDEKKSTRGIYRFDPENGKMESEPFMLIEKADFKKVADEKFNFYPSAIGVHPVTGDIYVLSTKETKGLARFSHDGKLKDFQWIDKKLMPQPEGLCFAPDGTLYISTEGKHGQPAKILRFSATKMKWEELGYWDIRILVIGFSL